MHTAVSRSRSTETKYIRNNNILDEALAEYQSNYRDDSIKDDIVSKLKRITWMSIETAKVVATLPTPFTDGWKPEEEV